ncbi:MAG: Gfo/Idh/MocA family oxidoreductase [Armatimonadetes bacterium]|nr:Gfo/Idh/MocA family oxidoreductase [Armatimonadota bacterium]
MSVRLGFIGCGGIANHHMRTLAQIEEADLVAFYDKDAERAKKAAAEYGGQAYDDLETMLDDADLQACYMCTPPFAHGEEELAVVSRGLGLFLEKPVARDMETARKVEAAIRQAGVVNAVGYHWRHMPSTKRAEEVLAGKTVTAILGYWMGGLPGVYWWRRMDLSGGQMVEQTTHIVDLARLFGGEVKAVAAAYGLLCLQDVEDLDVPDVGTMTLYFESGAVGTISNCCHLKMGFRVGIDIVACDTVVSINGNRLTLKTEEGTEDEQLEGDPTLAEDLAFVQAVATGDTSGIRSDYSDAVRTLAVSLAANLSAEEKRVVEIAQIG